MEKMPEIVRSRLARKTAQSSVHPDANLLSAFAEHALPERERAAVVAHLIECADCRESVALALAAAEPEAAVLPGYSAAAGFRGWFREWQWIASAAAACCLVAVTLQFYSAPPARVAPVRVYSKVGEPQVAREVPRQPLAPPVPRTLARKQKVEALPGGTKEAPVLVVADKELTTEGVVTPAAPPVVAPPAQPAEAALALQGVVSPKAAAVSSFVQPEQRAALKKQTQSASAARLFAVPPGPAGVVPGFTMKPGLKVMERTKLVVQSAAEPARVLWSINASADRAGKSRGVVERSIDAGQSWQVVPLSERVSFRSVANSGSDVWVGGSEGTLFYSSDGGAHWAEIKVASENAKLSDDIVRIDLRGPTQVTITTASGELWTSEDGKHWTRE
jgi:hypothetical protein